MEPKIALIINSCWSYHTKALPVLLASAKEANVPFEDIYVVVGDCTEEDRPIGIETTHGYQTVFCRYINIDFNAAIYFTQTDTGRTMLQQYTHFFYLHDTTELLPHFWQNMHVHAKNCPKYLALESSASKNMGLFQVQWFLDNRRELLSYIVNYDASKKMDMKYGRFDQENLIRERFTKLPFVLNEDLLVEMGPGGAEFSFPQDNLYVFFTKKYGESVRLGTCYPEVGLIKYQANWGQSEQFCLDI
jgi:hypothetical protein